ncbi:MAG: hypothetical protein ACOCTN_07390 [Candidatus Natronoplasma sp.]
MWIFDLEPFFMPCDRILIRIDHFGYEDDVHRPVAHQYEGETSKCHRLP